MDGRLLAYVLVSALLIVTPGPDTALIVRTALRSGARSASLAAGGVGAGSLVWAVASVLGIAALLETSAGAFTTFKLASAAFLIALGVRSLVLSVRRPGELHGAPSRRALAGRSAFMQGLANNLLNPKAGAIFVTVMPQFLRPGDSPVRLVIMLACYEVMVVSWLCMYARVVDRAARSRAGATLRRIVERAAGAVMVGLGVRVALERG
jgi:threonine/homoserine/homoserine lactone efflux protein